MWPQVFPSHLCHFLKILFTVAQPFLLQTLFIVLQNLLLFFKLVNKVLLNKNHRHLLSSSKLVQYMHALFSARICSTSHHQSRERDKTHKSFQTKKKDNSDKDGDRVRKLHYDIYFYCYKIKRLFELYSANKYSSSLYIIRLNPFFAIYYPVVVAAPVFLVE